MRRPFAWILAGSLLAGPAALANKREVSDLTREIDTQRAAAADLERLDDQRAVTAETTNLRSWLDEASSQLAKEEMDKTREVLARCIAQSELIRQKIAAAKGTRRPTSAKPPSRPRVKRSSAPSATCSRPPSTKKRWR